MPLGIRAIRAGARHRAAGRPPSSGIAPQAAPPARQVSNPARRKSLRRSGLAPGSGRRPPRIPGIRESRPGCPAGSYRWQPDPAALAPQPPASPRAPCLLADADGHAAPASAGYARTPPRLPSPAERPVRLPGQPPAPRDHHYARGRSCHVAAQGPAGARSRLGCAWSRLVWPRTRSHAGKPSPRASPQPGVTASPGRTLLRCGAGDWLVCRAAGACGEHGLVPAPDVIPVRRLGHRALTGPLDHGGLIQQYAALAGTGRLGHDLRKRFELADHHRGHAQAGLADLLERALHEALVARRGRAGGLLVGRPRGGGTRAPPPPPRPPGVPTPPGPSAAGPPPRPESE